MMKCYAKIILFLSISTALAKSLTRFISDFLVTWLNFKLDYILQR